MIVKFELVDPSRQYSRLAVLETPPREGEYLTIDTDRSYTVRSVTWTPFETEQHVIVRFR